jgi:ribose transport system permease protein
LAFVEIGRGKIGPLPIPVLIFLVVLVFGYLFLSFTRTGREVYALGGNEEAARASGIRTNRIKLLSYTLSSLTAGISGVILASRLSTGSPIIGEDSPLSVITSVLLGGTSLTGGVGSIGGSLLGLLTVGSLSNGLNLLNVPAYYQRVAKGLLLIIVIIIDSLYAQARKRALHRTRGKEMLKP